MDNERVQELLFQLAQDISYIKGRLDTLDELKIETKEVSNKIEKLEMQNERHEKQIASLENRSSTMEQFTRNNMNDSRKQMVSVYISLGMAIVSAVISFVFNMF